MLSSNGKAMGVIFPNSYDRLVPELVNVRLMASIPFASRYRMIDFVLSSMVNSGVDNVAIVVRDNYFSLMDHLGSGRAWDLTRKNGGLNIFPPFADKTSKPYIGRVDALASLLGFLKAQKEKYIFLSDSNIAVNFDFKAMLEAHVESGADVTAAYNVQQLPASIQRAQADEKGFYYTFDIENGRVRKIYVNPRQAGDQNYSMNIYVMDREMLIDKVNTAFVRGQMYFERDILAPHLDTLNVQAYKFDGYVARITDIPSYFNENMKLLKEENLDALFSGAPIYTKIRDDNPTRYINGAKVKNSMAADGCVIEGEVENSILFRGVKVAKGAVVKNCILMQDTVIEAGAKVEYLITDKKVTVTEGKEIKGSDTYPVYIAKGHSV